MRTYKITNGTYYDARTPDEIIEILENSRQSRTRLHISLGDTNTGRDWLEEHESQGYVGRSMGPVKAPLLVATRRSVGGGTILDHCIVRIRHSCGGRVLYQHPTYHHGPLEIREITEPLALSDGRILTIDVLRDGEVHAAFENVAQARRWAKKLGVTSLIGSCETGVEA